MCKVSKLADPLGLVTNPKTSKWADPLGLTKTKLGDPAGIFKSEHERQAALAAEKNKTEDPEQKPLVYLSNPWLDGLGIAGTNARGRNSLRVDAGSPVVQTPRVVAAPLPAIPATPAPKPTVAPRGRSSFTSTAAGLGIRYQIR